MKKVLKMLVDPADLNVFYLFDTIITQMLLQDQ
jgi:hypothetical protein